MSSGYLIPASDIELETGLGKELLRKWRQRYGFPLLEIGADGNVGYSRESIKQLLLIKRLIEEGFRPAQIVNRSLLELERLRQTIDNDLPKLCLNEISRRLLDRLKSIDMKGFETLLHKERAKGTLSEFVLNTIAPLINAVGDAWSQKEIEIYHEHLCTRVIERFLHAEILSCKPKRAFPRVLLATPPEERHSLGLLMVEAVFAEHGAINVSMGTHIPLNDLKLAAKSSSADVVALSFSFAYPSRKVRPTLLHLRFLLPSHVELWAGGAGNHKKSAQGYSHIFRYPGVGRSFAWARQEETRLKVHFCCRYEFDSFRARNNSVD